ncbi:MAG TPA: biopolymer transporter ExbD [Blastocatellia bacterium]|nr:biopolymer transporter ExbD [Blastocatellia bacterium]
MPPPNINVTPLIDVLLVLLIIFMVISPTKPHRFEAKIPEKPPENQPQDQTPDPFALVVTIPTGGGGYKLNQTDAKTLPDLSQLLHNALDGRPADRKAVFIKAPEGLAYGEVVKAIDIVKEAGGSPIGLQIEGLEH